MSGESGSAESLELAVVAEETAVTGAWFDPLGDRADVLRAVEVGEAPVVEVGDDRGDDAGDDEDRDDDGEEHDWSFRESRIYATSSLLSTLGE